MFDLKITKLDFSRQKFFAVFLAVVLGGFIVSNVLGYRYFNFVNDKHSKDTPHSRTRSHYYYHK